MAKRKMRSLTIKELSGVDKPAQAPAKALIFKRADGKPEPVTPSKLEEIFKGLAPDIAAKMTIEKLADMLKRGAAWLTTATDGHTHLVMLEDFEGNKVVSGVTSWQDEHAHPWVMLEDGTIVIGEVDDHDHEPDRESKVANADNPEDPTMSGNEATDLAKANERIDALTKRLDRADAINKLAPALKAYFDGLGEQEQDAFLEKSDEDRTAAVEAARKAAEDTNPVIYKDDQGSEYRKNDDPRLVAMAKQGDDDRKELKKARDAAEKAALEKRANELAPNLSNAVPLLKAAEAIEDKDEREGAIASIKAASQALDPAFQTLGQHTFKTEPDAGSPEDKLQKMADDYAKQHDVDNATAYVKVLETPEGERLYNEQRAAKPNHASTAH